MAQHLPNSIKNSDVITNDSISEQFTKLLNSDILTHFDESDIKGAVDTRNFIAHDYKGINLPIIEFIIRERLPIIKSIIEDIIKD